MAIRYDYGTGEYRNWIVAETAFNAALPGKFETIFCLGNGYMGLRATTEERYLEEKRGFYISGTFDQFKAEITELPNFPDWLGVEITLNGECFSLARGKVRSYSRRLNLKDGELVREVEWENANGNRTKLVFTRFVSFENLHLAGLKIEIEPLNYDAGVTIQSGFDGQVTNSGVQHFVEGDKRVFKEKKRYYMTAKTQESDLEVVLAAQHLFSVNGQRININEKFRGDRRQLFVFSALHVKERDTLVFEKIVSMYTGRDREFSNQGVTTDAIVRKTLANLEAGVQKGYSELFEQSKAVWRKKWEEMDITIDGPDFDQLALRFAQFHLLQMTPAHDSRLSIAAKGLSGEGYKGHVFWDTEIFILPFFIYSFPETARKLLEYRYHTFEGARKKAQANGYQGAMYAWESALTGEETTPKWGVVDIATGKPIRIWCGEIEHHITVDVAYGLWHYFQATQDHDFMLQYGYEILFDTANFWNSRLEYNQTKDRYDIHNVIGPDEYSEHVDNNAYTNYMVQWHLREAVECSQWLEANHENIWKSLNERLHIEQHQQEWKDKADKIYVTIDEETGVIPQYDGFMEKKVIDLAPYTGKTGTIFDDLGWEEIKQYQVLKQADVVMLLYLLGNQFAKEVKRANWNFYEPKTLHDSSLSRGMHSILANDMEASELAYQYFKRASRIDLGDNMQSCNNGLHSAALGGLWQAVVNGFAGARIHGDQLSISPYLPEQWKRLRFNLNWRGETICISIDKKHITLKKESGRNTTIHVEIYEKDYKLNKSGLVVNYGRTRL